MRALVVFAGCLTLAVCFAPVGRAFPAARARVARQVEAGLRGTPLQGTGRVFEIEGWRYDVSPFLVAAISGTESSFGFERCGFNVFGWNSCQGSVFSSFADAIRVVTRALRRSYIAKGLRSVEAIGVVYCACGSHWAQRTSWFMVDRFHASTSVVYPR